MMQPSANIAWVMSEEPFFPHAEWLNTLRLRAAYGRTERYRRGAIIPTALPFFSFLAPGTPVPEPTPERTSETEMGVDASLFGGRVDAALTYYSRTTSDLATIEEIAASSGTRIAVIGAGSMRNRGVEALVHLAILRSNAINGDLTVSAASNTNTMRDVGAPRFLDFGVQRVQSGYPAGGYWQRPILAYQDLDGDGVISPANCPGPACELQLGDTSVFLGSAFPTRELSLAPVVTIARRVTISALLDYRGGFKRYNDTRAFRCGTALTCRALYDPAAPLADQAAAIANLLGSDAGYIEDASFWKLRDLSVRLAAPPGWAKRLALHGASLTLSGHNLVTWTGYRGLDPESNAFPSEPLSGAELFTQPPVRYFTARLDVTW